MEYTLKATELKSGKTLYQVINENGVIVAKRTSTRKYVACTIDGGFFFGRIDLVGKGEHGQMINRIKEYEFNSTIEAYNQFVTMRVRETRACTRLHLETWLKFTPIEKQNASMSPWMHEHLVEFYGKDVADSCKTQKDFQIATNNVEHEIEQLMKTIGTFEEWRENRLNWAKANRNKIQVAYLN